jgi:hypothetical protein
MRVFCENKDEFTKLQRYLIDDCNYIWNNKEKEFYPKYYDWENGIAVIIITASKSLLYEDPSNNTNLDYINYDDFMNMEKINNMKKFIMGVFKDIL